MNWYKKSQSTSSPSKLGDGWLFALSSSEDSEVGWFIAIVSREYWDKHHSMESIESPSPIQSAFASVGLDEVMEGTFEPDGRYPAPAVKTALENAGFVNDPSFQSFLS